MGKCISKEFQQPLHIRELAESTPYIATDDEYQYYYDDEVGFTLFPPITDFYRFLFNLEFLERSPDKNNNELDIWHLTKKFNLVLKIS